MLKLEDLQPGMELKGTVLNVVDFGAFVDIGLKDSGLVHISQLANRYIKSPHDVVSVGDVVTAWVMGVDHERKRVSLTMVKPGTERPRGGPPGGGRARRRRGKAARAARRGGERRGGRRGPAPDRGGRTCPASALGRQPPVGTAAGAVAARNPGEPGEGAPPRPDRPGRWSAARTRRPAAGRARGGRLGRGGPGPSRAEAGPGGSNAPRHPGRHSHARPNKPAPPPPPLSKDALAGSVPLRTFGQLKQLWQARESDTDEVPTDAPPPDQAAPPENPAPEGTGESTE